MSKARKVFAWFSLSLTMLGIFIMLGSEKSDHWISLLFTGLFIMVAGWRMALISLDSARFLRHLFAHYVVFFSIMWKLGMRNEKAELAYETRKEFNNVRWMYKYLAERYYMENANES